MFDTVKVVGVDLGVRKAACATFIDIRPGIVMLDNAVAVHAHPTTRPAELHTISLAVMALCEDADYVFIEEPLMGRGVKASMQISQTAGAIMSVLSASGVHTELVNVKTWKKQIIGNGNASKIVISDHLKMYYPAYSDVCGDDADKKDAVCVGLFGLATVLRVQNWFPHDRSDQQKDQAHDGFLAESGHFPPLDTA